MTTKKEEITKIEYVTTYIADDGTEFKSEEECRKYESTAEGVINAMFEKLPNQKTYDPINSEFPYFGCDDTVVAVKIRSMDDVEIVNKWLKRRDCHDGMLIGAESIGSIHMFCIYDYDNCVWNMGTVEQFKKTCSDAIDTFVNKLGDKTEE